MRITLKLVIYILLGILTILCIDGYVSVNREIEFFDKQLKRHAQLLGHTLKVAVEEVWKNEGKQSALELINSANKQEHSLKIRWVELNNESNQDLRPKIPFSRLDSVIDGNELFIKEKTEKKDAFFISYIPVSLEGIQIGALELAESLQELETYTNRTVINISLLMGLTALVCGIIALTTGVILIGRPLNLLMEKTAQIGRGNLTEEIKIKGRNELSKLALTIEEMCQNLLESQKKVEIETKARMAAFEQLRHTDRLRTIGRFASGIAHEMGTPLNIISGRAELILGGKLASAKITECARIIKDQSKHITSIVQQLLTFAQQPSSKKQVSDLMQITLQVKELLEPICKQLNIDLQVACKTDCTKAIVSPGKFQQVLTNLINNSIHAMPNGGHLEVGIEADQEIRNPKQTDEAAKYICIYVKDEGEGIADEIKPHLFEPFFTTKETGKGSGLGLSIVHSIVQEYSGFIEISSKLNNGSCFFVYFKQDILV